MDVWEHVVKRCLDQEMGHPVLGLPTGLGNPVRAVLAAIETVTFQAVKEAALME